MRIVDSVFVYQLTQPHLIQWHTRRHAHPSPEWELHYFLGGDGSFVNGRSSYRIEPGMVFLTQPGRVHTIRSGAMEDPISYFAILFAPKPEGETADLLEAPDFLPSFPRRAGRRERILFEELHNRFAHPNKARRQAGAHLLQAYLWDLFAGAGEPATSGETKKNSSVHVDRAVALFHRHVTQNLRVRDIAHRIGISQPHLTRLFSSHFGVSPLQYLRRLRMERGASMLLNSTDSIKEISWKLGYSSPFHFSRSFAQFAGASPTLYRGRYFQTAPTDYATKLVDNGDEL